MPAKRAYADLSVGYINFISRHIQDHIELAIRSDQFQCWGEVIQELTLLPAHYAQRSHRPIWFNAFGIHPGAFEMLEVIRNASLHGLRPHDYHFYALNEILYHIQGPYIPMDSPTPGDWAAFDILLTDAFLTLGSHMTLGRVNPENLYTDWRLPRIHMDLVAILKKISMPGELSLAMDKLNPSHPQYNRLRNALRKMQHIQMQGGWPHIPGVPFVRPKSSDFRVITLRERLHLSGDLPVMIDSDKESQVYDPRLVKAVKSFQKRHGLKPDGVVGPKTLIALNVSPKQLLTKIELNIERLRWLPYDLGKRYIWVNTAGYYLKVIEKDRQVMSMRVVVGRPARRTPVFSTSMTYMVLNPYWTVPPRLAREDILPHLVQEPDYIKNNGFRIFNGWAHDSEELDAAAIDWKSIEKNTFPFRLRQDPGPENFLGKIKFMFPNKYNVYLHDTPNRNLFKKTRRSFSSGCIRVEDAPGLAVYLVKNDNRWGRNTLEKILKSQTRTVVLLKDPLPVHLIYLTAWVDDKGKLQIREDIYHRDQVLETALAKGPIRSSSKNGDFDRHFEKISQISDEI
ncbi:MAG: L,D-transpeptidase family protein [Desulfobacteraceae bacterium]|nr:L,D-transpeptidase family protein [Desulfobacteraceae bacterium]